MDGSMMKVFCCVKKGEKSNTCEVEDRVEYSFLPAACGASTLGTAGFSMASCRKYIPYVCAKDKL